MATYSKGMTVVSYNGWDTGAAIIYAYGHAYWGFTVTGDVVYRGKKRYLHVTKVSINAKVTISQNLVERIIYIEECDPDAAICVIRGIPIYKNDIENIANGYPGGGQVKLRCTTNPGNVNGTIYSSHGVGINLGTGLSSKLRASVNGAQTWTNSATVTTNFDLELTNDPCYLNLFLQTWGGSSIDWGHLTSGYFPLYVPNTPGTQYYTGSKWETHRIKRWNGSSWVDIPGRRWNGSSWDEIQG